MSHEPITGGIWGVIKLGHLSEEKWATWMIIQVPDGFGAQDLAVTGAWVHYQSGSTGFSLGPEGCHAAQAPLALQIAWSVFLCTDAHTVITDLRWRPNAEPLSWLALHFLTACPSEDQPLLARNGTSCTFSRCLADCPDFIQSSLNSHELLNEL